MKIVCETINNMVREEQNTVVAPRRMERFPLQ